MLRGLSRRELFLLIVLWLVAAALVCGLVAWFLTSRSPAPVDLGQMEAPPSPAPAPTYTVPFVEVTARRLYPAAEALARAWEPDVQLVGANASWTATALNLVGNPTDWSFSFYSPARERLYLAGVSSDGQAVGAPHFQKESAPPLTINLAAWAVDSPEALARWLDQGGGALLGQNPGANVIIQLGASPAGSSPTWTITGFDSGGGQTLTLTVDAATGQVSVIGGEP